MSISTPITRYIGEWKQVFGKSETPEELEVKEITDRFTTAIARHMAQRKFTKALYIPCSSTEWNKHFGLIEEAAKKLGLYAYQWSEPKMDLISVLMRAGFPPEYTKHYRYWWILRPTPRDVDAYPFSTTRPD